MNATVPRTGLDRFRAAVLRDPAIQQALAEHYDPAEFATLALDYAAHRGLALTRDDLRAPQGHAWIPAPQRVAPLRLQAWPDTPWLPVALSVDDGIAVDWAHFAGIKPAHPFFQESAMIVGSRPFNRLFRPSTALDAFVAGAGDCPAPRGVIFHMSRCGSTLVSQMLGAASDTVVLSEPPAVDTLLQLPLDPPLHVAALRAMGAALGRGHAHAVIKTDAWHTLAMPLLLGQAFPEVPWIFLYRDPVEVLVSHERMSGRQVVPGVVPALDHVRAGTHGADHAARSLAAICEAVLAYGVARGGLLVHYDELPDAVFTRILPHFGIDPSPDDRARIAAAALRDAKSPHAAFSADGEGKRREASAQVHAAAEQHLAPVYAALQAARRG